LQDHQNLSESVFSKTILSRKKYTKTVEKNVILLQNSRVNPVFLKGLDNETHKRVVSMKYVSASSETLCISWFSRKKDVLPFPSKNWKEQFFGWSYLRVENRS